MKDVKSIFKHSGAGTGFYGGAHWTCHCVYDPDQQAFDGNLYGDQQTGERGILDEVPGRDYGFSESEADMCAVACPGTCGIGENGGSETVSSDGIGFGGVIGDELL